MNTAYSRKIENEALQSETIALLRFPLIVGVVLAHSSFGEFVVNGVGLISDESFPVFTVVSYLFGDIISQIVIPLFFFISGFLFFYKTPFFTAKVYGSKLKKRAKTILIPYLFWNLLTIALFFLVQTFLPQLTSGYNKPICDYAYSDWLAAFWSIIDGRPICFQFWFLRDLMVVMLFSPFVYFLLKKLRHYAVIGLGLFWLLNVEFGLIGFSVATFFFFSAGAYFSIYKRNFVSLMSPFFPLVAVLYILIAIIMLCFRDQSWCDYLNGISTLVGLVLAIGLSAYFLRKGLLRVNYFLSGGSFFIYAYHGMILTFVIKMLFRVIQPHSDGMMLALYVICPLIVIAAGLLIYYNLKKYFPFAIEIITGGR